MEGSQLMTACFGFAYDNRTLQVHCSIKPATDGFSPFITVEVIINNLRLGQLFFSEMPALDRLEAYAVGLVQLVEILQIPPKWTAHG